MPRSLVLLFVLMFGLAPSASARTTGADYADAPAPSLATVAKRMHETIRRDLAEAAAAMPADEYAFRPAPEVRTFGQLIGHVINANLFFCSQVSAEKLRTSENFEQVTEKAALVKALDDSLAFCDRAYDATTDSNFHQPVRVGPGVGMRSTDTVRGAVLMFNMAHNNEHYGNVVVYMRLKGHVPPSTARSEKAKQ